MADQPMSCSEVEDLAAALALGGIGGAERAAALAHLARCDACRTLVDQLARAADSILLVAPVVEPPAGFESRVLARIAAAAEPVPLRPRRSRRRLWVGAAAVALVAAMSGLGVAELGHGGNRGAVPTAVAPIASVRTALAQDPAGRWTCQVVVYGTQPTRLVVSLDRTDGLSAGFSVEALREGSEDPIPVGTFTISEGHGSLATTVDLQAGQFRSVRVLDQTGKVRYEAVFPPAA
jgi:anti-sigma factor RsiW